MRRLAAGIFVAVVVSAITIGAGGEAQTYRVDAVFDSTANLIPGQDVKIAGARVGAVTDIELTEDRKARVEMEIEEGFAPFHADAECTIRPQSLIGEKFVQCRPGTPDEPALQRGDEAPTVPLERTHSPVDLDLVFAALRRPYSQRLAIIVNELGTGLAGRSDDLNEAIRRANPALQEANELLEILDRDRDSLAALVDQSDEVIAKLAGRSGQVRSFIGRADRVSQTVANRRAELGVAIERMPELLAELEPTAGRLEALASDATPTLRDLRAAAPLAKELVADFDPVADAARPALVALSETSKTGRRAVKAARPVADSLQPVAEILPPIVKLGAQLTESLRDKGAVEHLLLYPFYATGATARFDQFSHILPSYQIAGLCQQYATAPVDGCDAHFGDDEAEAAASAGSAEPRKQRRRSRERREPITALPHAGDRDVAPPARNDVPPSIDRGSPPGGGSPVNPILDWLLGP
jgi:ABC-type transporter Mla subunit MlaD